MIEDTRTYLFRENLNPSESSHLYDFVDRIRFTVIEYLENGNLEEDSCFDIVDSCMPIYNFDIVDCITSDTDLLYREPDYLEGDLLSIMTSILFETGYSICSDMINDLLEQ